MWRASLHQSRRLSIPVGTVAALSLVVLHELDQDDATDSQQRPVASTATSSGALLNRPHGTQYSLFSYNNQYVQCEADNPVSSKSRAAQRLLLRTRQTVRRMERDSSQQTLESRYDVDWDTPLGEGSFGVVYLGLDRVSGERVAVKKISKAHTTDTSLQLELQALLHLRDSGGHPNICSLRQNFSSRDGYYYLILDLIEGGEMFEHLVSQGAYSEADAARLVREVASALAFLHGVNVIHCDLKPENLMLSSKSGSDAVIKLIDFGCAVAIDEDDDASASLTGRTLAYCPPEVLNRQCSQLDPSVDMWALGIILYIMLTGIHPYDLSGQASDEEVAASIISGKAPPLKNSPITAHLSDSAIDLIDKLMKRDPKQRITADQMLVHPWTRGLTASHDIMADSSKKLSLWGKVYKSGIAEKVFSNAISWSEEKDNDDVARRTSLIERSFRAFDPQQKGYLTAKDLKSMAPPDTIVEGDDKDSSRLSLSGFSDLLAENMSDVFYPKGTVVYYEGEIGNAMYFINSGTISVETTGSVVKRGPGDYFGEGALLNPKKVRSATIKCDTPVHVMKISRNYFEKYLARTDSDLMITLREKDKIRKRNRAKKILRLQKNLKVRQCKPGELIFSRGDCGDSLFLVESGKVNILSNDNHVFTAGPSNVFGEHSLITKRPRNSTALCSNNDEDGCTLLEMAGPDFRRLVYESPDILGSLRDLCLRRDFKKAVVLRLGSEFPYHNPAAAYDAVKAGRTVNHLDFYAIASLMREQLNPDYSDADIREIMQALDLTNSGNVSFDEFKKIFVADIRKSASI